MFKSTYLSMLALFFVSTAFGQITWQPLNGPTGASDIKILAADQSGRLFLHHGQQFFTSTDDGDSWISSTDGIPASEIIGIASVLVLPNGQVVAHTNYKYYDYNANTNSWTFNLQLSNLGELSLDDQQRLWQVGGSWEDISYSTDGGQTFTMVLEGENTEGWHNFMANHNDQHNLVAVSYGAQAKVYHFTIDGTYSIVKTISGIVEYLGYNPFSATAFMSDLNNAWRSADGGLTWTNIALKVDPSSSYSSHIYNLFYESATKIWASTSSGIFVSEDDGANWTFLSLETYGYVQEFFRKGDGTFFFSQECSDKDFSRSTDEGQTWTDISESFKYPNVNNIVVAKNEVIYALNCSQYDRSTDGGQSWSPAMIMDSVSSRMTNLAVLPDGDLFSFSPNNHIIRSTDGGNTWNLVTQPPVTSWIGFGASIAADPFGNLYAFYEYEGSYKSVDKGQTWQPIQLSTSSISDTPHPLFHPNGDIFFINYSYILHYIAAQDTVMFEEVIFPDNEFWEIYQTIITAQGDLIFLANNLSGGNGNEYVLYRYGNNHEAEPLNFPISYPAIIAAAPNGLAFATSQDSLYQSDNSGLQWTFAGKLPTTNSPYYQTQGIYVGNDQHLYAAYNRDIVYRSTLPVTPNNLITGVIWYDENNNCIKDNNELPLANHYIQAQGSSDYGGFSYTDGRYQIFASDGNYQVSASVPNALFKACPPVNVVVGAQNDTVHTDVALQAVTQCPYLRVSASTPLLRRCFPNTYIVHYSNEGTAPAIGAYIEVTLDSLFNFQSASVPPVSQNGQVFTFSVGDLAPGASGHIWIKIEVSCMASLQQEHCFKAQIFPGTPCLPSLTDLSIAEECQANIGSFDPNDKRAFVDGKEEPGTVLPDKSIEYLIRFQNTGTDTAFTVVVEDYISGVLDLASVTPLVSSHPFRMELGPNRNLRFIFDQILLPDSNINEVASHGFIKFAVQQVANLPSGTDIRNDAAIYFDFNAPVLTNTSHLVVTRPTGTYEPTPGYSAQAFPNPFHDLINFRITGPNTLINSTLLLTDALGRVMQRKQFTGNDCQLSREDLPTGMYFFAVLGENGQWLAAGRVMAE